MKVKEDLLTVIKYVNPLLEERRTALAILRNSPLTTDYDRSCLRALEQCIAELESLVERYQKQDVVE